MEKHRILLVEPETLVRTAIKRLISDSSHYCVCCEASTLEEAHRHWTSLAPDFVLTEIALPGASGIELLIQLFKTTEHTTRAAVLSQIDSLEMVKHALVAGAKGYILKNQTEAEFFSALDAIYDGKVYVPPHLDVQTLTLPENAYSKDNKNDPLDLLSTREREIFHMLANGHPNHAIAKKLFISPRTVETHRSRIVRKLGITTNAELIRYAIKHGLTVL